MYLTPLGWIVLGSVFALGTAWLGHQWLASFNARDDE